MSKYPFRLLPKSISGALLDELGNGRWVAHMPHTVDVDSAKTWHWYMDPLDYHVAFTINVNTKSNLHIIEFGEEGGGRRTRLVDRDKTKQNLVKDTAIVHGYIDRMYAPATLVNVQVIMNVDEALPIVPDVKLTKRERNILYCFGTLKPGPMRKEALLRLGVTDRELKKLCEKQVIKETKIGPMMTLIGEANRLPPLASGQKLTAIDQW